MGIGRRQILALGLGLVSARSGLARTLTPRQSTGPFYPVEFPPDDDADLTRVQGQANPALGEITDLSGRILDERGRPVSDARIEIWQCDVNGRYLHPGDRAHRPRDPGFQGHGAATTDSGGRYTFRTIKPVSYPGRTPHIHVAVFTWAEEPFVTQLYIAGHPDNERDFLFNHIPAAQRPLVEVDFRPVQHESVRYQAQFDVYLSGLDGTPRG